MSAIMMLDNVCLPNNSASMDFSIPVYDNIFVIQADTLDSDIQGIYYGDEIDLELWGLLGLSMDSGRTYTTSYELTSGYTYTYYVSRNKFVITDSKNVVVFENDDIKGINDFCIDLEVEASHQFHVIFDPFSDIYSFYKVAKLDNSHGNGETMSFDSCCPNNIFVPDKVCPFSVIFDPFLDICSFYKIVGLNNKFSNGEIVPSGSCGTNNISVPDRIRPYLPTDVDNPSWGVNLLSNCTGTIIIDSSVCGLIAIDVLNGYRFCKFDYSKLKPSNNFYHDLTSFVLEASLNRKHMVSYLLSLSIIVPDLSNNMFPQLLPIEGAEGVDSGIKPVYEPWLIWGILKFIATRTTIDKPDKDFEVYSFDLSPVYE